MEKDFVEKNDFMNGIQFKYKEDGGNLKRIQVFT